MKEEGFIKVNLVSNNNTMDSIMVFVVNLFYLLQYNIIIMCSNSK